MVDDMAVIGGAMTLGVVHDMVCDTCNDSRRGPAQAVEHVV